MTALRTRRQPCNIRRSRGGYVFAVVLSILAGLLIPLLSGCRTSPDKKAAQAVAAVEKAKKAEVENHDKTTAAAAGFVVGASLALDREKDPTPAVELARSMTRRAGLSLGEPDYGVAMEFDRIVTGLLSASDQDKAEARRLLMKKDAEIVGLQEKLKKLEAVTVRAEEKKDEILFTFAGEAATWRRIKFWIFLGLGAVVFSAVMVPAMGALGTAFPLFSPLTSLVGSLFGWFARRTFTAIPNAAAKAGVVAASAHASLQAAAEDMTHLIARAKQTPEVWARMKPAALEITDDTTRPVIEGLKTTLKFVTPLPHAGV